MKVGKPIPIEEIPGKHGARISRYEEIYREALSLNGAALPVDCDDLRTAIALMMVFSNKDGKGKAVGLKAHRRGNTVYVYKP